MMRQWIVSLFFATTATIPAHADDSAPLVVLELFTSQGCSACPPADDLLGELAHQPGVLPLSIHVDYWDYIGWKDTFAEPAFTRRQKAYAKNFGQRMIYTPEMVIQGQLGMVGHKADEIARAVDDVLQEPAPVHIGLSVSDGLLRIKLEPLADDVPPSDVHLVRYLRNAVVQIGRGENAGRQLEYTNVVDEWHTLTLWDGKSERELDVPLPGDQPAAVIVQAHGQGPILAAARLE